MNKRKPQAHQQFVIGADRKGKPPGPAIKNPGSEAREKIKDIFYLKELGLKYTRKNCEEMGILYREKEEDES